MSVRFLTCLNKKTKFYFDQVVPNDHVLAREPPWLESAPHEYRTETAHEVSQSRRRPVHIGLAARKIEGM